MAAANCQAGIVVAIEVTRIGMPGMIHGKKKLEKAAYLLLKGNFLCAWEPVSTRAARHPRPLAGPAVKLRLSLHRLLNTYEWDPI